MKERSAKRYALKREVIKATQKRWRATHKEYGKQKSAEWRKQNPERRKAIANAWAARNRPARAAALAEYKASLIQATPAWLTQDERKLIREVYKQAAEQTRATGVKHHVDHVYPLRGTTVCGLHVVLNLQILTEKENVSKSNKF